MKFFSAIVGLMVLSATLAAQTQQPETAYNERPYPEIMSQAELDRVAELVVNLDSATELFEYRKESMVNDCNAVFPSPKFCECLASTLPVGIKNFALYAGVMLRQNDIDLADFSDKDQGIIKATFVARTNCSEVASGRRVSVVVTPWQAPEK